MAYPHFNAHLCLSTIKIFVLSQTQTKPRPQTKCNLLYQTISDSMQISYVIQSDFVLQKQMHKNHDS